MEKLKELLNEFDPYIAKDGEHRDNLWYMVYNGGSAIFSKGIGILVIISKEYGFIKWLVKENKINHHKISDIMIYSQWRYTGTNKTTAQRVDENFLDLLLMLLSIQDNPIEFLVSILK